MTENFKDENFLIYLKNNFKYLYDIEMYVRSIRDSGGYGTLYSEIRMMGGLVDKCSFSKKEEKIYVKRKDNRLSN